MKVAAGTLRPGSEADHFSAAFHPEWNCFSALVVHSQNHSISTRLRHADVCGTDVGMRTFGTPIVHEFLERVVAARSGFRAAPHAISGLKILLPQIIQETFDLLLFGVIFEEQIAKAGYHQEQQQNKDAEFYELGAFRLVLLARSVSFQVAGHRQPLFYRIGFVVRRHGLIGDIESRLEKDRVARVDHHIQAFGFGQLSH